MINPENTDNQEWLEIPLSCAIDYSLSVPGSKSISNRALLIAALAKGDSKLHNLLKSVDTKVMLSALNNLGVKHSLYPNYVLVSGQKGSFDAYAKEIMVENAGTAARFLTATLSLGAGKYILTGNERMQQRPIADLITAINNNGGSVQSLRGDGCLPLEIIAQPLAGGEVKICGINSSQYVSALMMAAPYARQDTTIVIENGLVSKGYVEMTKSVMQQFKAEVDFLDSERIWVGTRKKYQAREYIIEADLSSASYFFALAAITGGRILVENLTWPSLQGDIEFIFLLEKMGCQVNRLSSGVELIGPQKLRGLGDVDLHHVSDVAPTLAVVAVFAEGRTTIRNVANMRLKECDRISALATELKKIGVAGQEFPDGLSIKGAGSGDLAKLKGARLETYDDHRMAMSLSLLGVKIPGIIIINPRCVTKTFPTYFDLFFEALKP